MSDSRFVFPLRTKVILLVVVWQVGGFAAFSVLRTFAEYRSSRTLLTESARLWAQCVGHACSMSMAAEGHAALENVLAAAAREHAGDLRYLFIVDSAGGFLAGLSPEDAELSRRIGGVSDGHAVRQIETPKEWHDAFLDVSTPVSVGGRLIGTLHLGVGDQSVRDRIWASLRQDLWLILLALAGGSFIAVFVDSRLRTSLRSLLDVTRLMSAGDLGRRVEIHTGDELQTLGESFNQMAAALEKSRDELEQRVRDRTVELQQEREKLSAIVEGLGAGLALVDQKQCVIWSNRAAQDLLGVNPPQIGAPCYRSIWSEADPCAQCPAVAAIQTGRIVRRDRLLIRNGLHRHFSVTASPIRDEAGKIVQAIELIEDVTDRKEMEARLIQADKLASLGQLASGVAHELGNPLGSIYLQAKLIQEDPSSVVEPIGRIVSDVERCRGIISDLNEFSRRSPGERERIDPGRLVEESLNLCRHLLEKNRGAVESCIAGRLPLCHVDPNKMKQVFVNLIQNAVQAQPSGGRIYLAVDAGQQEIIIEIRDEGPGIPPEILPRIFEPFFTTKPDGTGLGLSICHGIIKEHGGDIRVRSTPSPESGHGTTFRVTLPVAGQRES